MLLDPKVPDPRGSAGPYPLLISGKPAVLVVIIMIINLEKKVFERMKISNMNFPMLNFVSKIVLTYCEKKDFSD